MEQLKVITSATECVAGPAQGTKALHVGEILSVCLLRGFQAISTCLLSVLQREGVDNTTGSKRSRDFNAGQPGQPLGSPNLSGSLNPLFVLQPPFLENKFIQLVRQFLTDISIPPAPPRPPWIVGLGRKSSSAVGSEPFADLKSLGHNGAPEARRGDVKSRVEREPTETDWDSLVKAAPATALSATALRTPSSRQPAQQGCAEKQGVPYGLAGRCILCVGGRAALYPEYRRVVEASGGRLMFYRKPQGEVHLPALLARADMVVCPVDCVNHHAFFAATRYCRQSGKLCVLLERSALPAFRKGIATLAAGVGAVAGMPAEKDQPVQAAKSSGPRSIQPVEACTPLRFPLKSC